MQAIQQPPCCCRHPSARQAGLALLSKLMCNSSVHLRQGLELILQLHLSDRQPMMMHNRLPDVSVRQVVGWQPWAGYKLPAPVCVCRTMRTVKLAVDNRCGLLAQHAVRLPHSPSA